MTHAEVSWSDPEQRTHDDHGHTDWPQSGHRDSWCPAPSQSMEWEIDSVLRDYESSQERALSAVKSIAEQAGIDDPLPRDDASLEALANQLSAIFLMVQDPVVHSSEEGEVSAVWRTGSWRLTATLSVDEPVHLFAVSAAAAERRTKYVDDLGTIGPALRTFLRQLS